MVSATPTERRVVGAVIITHRSDTQKIILTSPIKGERSLINESSSRKHI